MIFLRDYLCQILSNSHRLINDETDEELAALVVYPTDLFACTTSLLDVAGAFSYFNPDPLGRHSEISGIPQFSFDDKTISHLCEMGAKWSASSDGYPTAEVYEKWVQFIAEHGLRHIAERADGQGVPRWWKPCAELMIVSDEAGYGLGTVERGAGRVRTVMQYHAVHRRALKFQSSDQGKEPKMMFSTGSFASFAKLVDANIHSVFPKSRISTAGCSHRNFSRNLALLPKAGSVRCQWHLPPGELVDDREKPIDILLIPYPYSVPSKAFKTVRDAKAVMDDHDNSEQSNGARAKGWGNFEIDQVWLDEEDPVELAKDLLLQAKKDVASVNGVVFPEYSLSYDKFVEVCRELKKLEEDLEFVISGTNSNCEYDPEEHRSTGNGNHVMTCVWHRVVSTASESDANSEAPIAQDREIFTSRRKHHRWMLSPEQLSDYALTSTLDPRVDWWEDHSIGHRELHFFPFRKKSIFTSMICEDLARSDPCHEVIRAIGPNLVFVLLMDGPQIASRWSARYASALSEDPGSSVLTLTSFGLIDRANKTRNHDPQEAIGFFASPFGKTSIMLPKDGAKAVLLTLTSELQRRQQTIDGRRDRSARSWRMSSSQPVYPSTKQ